jgi:hypothetical protein
LAAALTPALVAEPASRPAGKQQTFCTSKSPRLTAGGFFCRDVDYCPVGMLFQPPAPGPNHFVLMPWFRRGVSHIQSST